MMGFCLFSLFPSPWSQATDGHKRHPVSLSLAVYQMASAKGQVKWWTFLVSSMLGSPAWRLLLIRAGSVPAFTDLYLQEEH